jgi:CheY-like chemotaxis protein
VIAQVVDTVEPLASQKQIHIETAVAGAGEILADEVKLKQMILNLVSNAIKFTPASGTVSVSATRTVNRLQVMVSDTGIGIAEQDIDRVFKEFQQVESSAGRKEQGTGLGLALTRRFAILHGGDVGVSSKVGKGSVFTLDLPVEARSPDRPPRYANGSVGDSSAPLVVVVEDDPAAAELLTRQIGRAGFRTQVARSGEAAVSMAKAHKPVAITLDILLPDADGWEVLTRLKRDEATRDIPVIVVSVVDDPQLGTALGALDYFVKPVDAKELVNRLSNYHLEHRSGDRATNVLVVDDEAANREWLIAVLEPAGFHVTLAKGGQEAIELARSLKPDLVLLDLLMPGVNGFDVVEALKEHEDTRGIPIMVLTAKHLNQDDIDQLNGHVSSILKRGSNGAVDLLAQLHAVLNQQTVGA